jgi:glycerol-3-phosphate dehydrogenase subunit B
MSARAPYDVVVVGLGLAGLVAGLAAASRGASVLVTGKGYGTLRFRTGTIDVLGYRDGSPVASPGSELPALAGGRPPHPYALAPSDLPDGLATVRAATAARGTPLGGDLTANQLIATAAGTLRPTCLAPPSMVAKWDGADVLVVGLEGYRDFEASLVAAVLPAAAAQAGLELVTRPVTVDLPSLHVRHLGGLELARQFEQPSFRRELAAAIQPALEAATLVALPAVVGLERHADAASELAERLGTALVELPTLPPSVPGLRLELALAAALREAGVRLQVGARVRVTATHVELEAAGHPLRIPARRLVLATGGFASGGLEVLIDGSVHETVADLPVWVPDGSTLFGRSFLEPGGHAAGLAGVLVDGRMRPVDASGAPLRDGLFCAGGVLAGARRAVEKSADGICCATGWRAGLEAAA